MRPLVKEVIVVNPHKMKLISFVNKKTDKVDAEKLAMFAKMQVRGEEELIAPVFVPEEGIRNLRSLFATYSNVKAQIVQTKNRIHALLKQQMVIVKPSELQSISGRKRLLALAALNPALAAWSESLVQRKKGAGKIRMGVVRKVITQIYQMLKKDEYHRFRNASLHAEKMAAFDKHIALAQKAA
ncbi:MAG: transposase [Spirochaetes bacterium]|nr:transposase [Spirochaetota bacterium]